MASKDQNAVKESDKKKSRRQPRAFDFSKHPSRQVALEIAYVGWDFKGFASQDDSDETIEGHLFSALKKTCLIESRATSHYSRCARTDKGVSALGQVISIRLRSTISTGLGVFPPSGDSKEGGADAEAADGGGNGGGAADSDGDGEDETQDARKYGKQYWLARAPGPTHPGCSDEDLKSELPYMQMINGCLPSAIRVVSWCPVLPHFNARFACSSRSYRYFFVKGHYDVEAMRDGAHRLVGEHDFMHFCKVDTSKPNMTTKRKILSFEVEPVIKDSVDSPYSIWAFEIHATAFLWHQVRAMAAILFTLGRREHPPEVVSWMLDTKKCTVKPAYSIASDEPLLLSHCHFPPDLVNFLPSIATHSRNDSVLDSLCSQVLCRGALVVAMRQSLSGRDVVSAGEKDPRSAKRHEADKTAGAASETAEDIPLGQTLKFTDVPLLIRQSFIPGHKRPSLILLGGTGPKADAATRSAPTPPAGASAGNGLHLKRKRPDEAGAAPES
mmetsp:Transcript_10623/g.25017  ORF Transcript_10623/g.25017 Transcript_10623/m.25017 type:complete len:499 (+) Transcript_10623:120-1616(+)